MRSLLFLALMLNQKSLTPRARAMPTRLTFIAAVAALAVLIAVTAGACERAGQKADLPAPQPEQKAKNPFEPTKDLPPDFVNSLPIYPGAQIEQVHKPKGAMRQIEFSTKASLAELVDFYKTQLKQRGFRITSALIMAARRTWSCDFQKERMQARVLLYPHDHDKSLMTINLMYELPSTVDPELMEPVENFDVVGPGEYVQKTTTQQDKVKRN